MPSGLQVVCRAAARRQFAANDLKQRAKAANRNPYFRPGASDLARFRPPHTPGPGRNLGLEAEAGWQQRPEREECENLLL